MDTRELAVLRRQTTHFINSNPVKLTMTRGGSKSPDGAGGYTVTPGSPITEQTFRMIPASVGVLSSRNVDGEVVNPAFVLIGEHDADVKKGDVFTHNGRNHEVIWVRDDRRYQSWSEVVYRG